MSYDFEKMGLREPVLQEYLEDEPIVVDSEEPTIRRFLKYPVEFTVDSNGGRCIYVAFEDGQDMMDVFEDILNWAMINVDKIGFMRTVMSENMHQALLKSLYEWFVVTEEDIKDE